MKPPTSLCAARWNDRGRRLVSRGGIGDSGGHFQDEGIRPPMKIASLCSLVLGTLLSATPVLATVDVSEFVRRDAFKEIKISPTGEFLAATVPREDRTGLIILRRATGERTAAFALGKDTHVAAFLVDDLPNDDKHVDNQGVVRFARGAGTDNVSKLYYRAGERGEWQLVNDEAQTNRVEMVLGFSPDDKIAYLQVEHPQGPDAVVAFDVATGERKPVFRDDASAEARLQRTLEAAFEGHGHVQHQGWAPIARASLLRHQPGGLLPVRSRGDERLPPHRPAGMADARRDGDHGAHQSSGLRCPARSPGLWAAPAVPPIAGFRQG
jgi:hypothetical protein